MCETGSNDCLLFLKYYIFCYGTVILNVVLLGWLQEHRFSFLLTVTDITYCLFALFNQSISAIVYTDVTECGQLSCAKSLLAYLLTHLVTY